MNGEGLTVMVGGVARPLCGCCLEAPACGDPDIVDHSFGEVCLECFACLTEAIDALIAADLLICRALGPDHDEGGAK